ncbi:hypothetical protein FQN53_004644 [Emmonsiellopsis sp. PD_33]|nr:hypothetical protein FQN53_004644 [Emmonsiellopsis sp. PD_33]
MKAILPLIILSSYLLGAFAHPLADAEADANDDAEILEFTDLPADTKYAVLLEEADMESSLAKIYTRSFDRSSAAATVSGVGLYDVDVRAPKNETAPLDYATRWDDPRYSTSNDDRLSVSARRGFFFHESCWYLLETAYYPDEIPCHRLFDVCRSLRSVLGQETLVEFTGDLDDHWLPWDLRPLDLPSAETLFYSAKNPYNLVNVQQLITQAASSPPHGQTVGSPKVGSAGETIVTRIPQEICEEICSYLPTRDFFSLRLASKSFASVFDSQHFWRSRFNQAVGERSWLFETWDFKEPLDWRLLYHCTSDSRISEELRNRARIWHQIQHLKQILSFRLSENAPPLLFGLPWTQVGASEFPRPGYYFNESYRESYKQCAPIPAGRFQIGFSVITIGYKKYIAGIRLIPGHGEDIYLGYHQPGGREDIVDINTLVGFNVAVGARGVHGIQAVSGDNTVSQWVGWTGKSPKTRRLSGSVPVLSIKVEYDGCKICSIGVSRGIRLVSEPQPKSLVDTALWYPSAPEPPLCINDDEPSVTKTTETSYLPLCCTLFGGPGGIYRRYLTGISCRYGAWIPGLRAIELHYNADSVPTECRNIGQLVRYKTDTVTFFPIDGQGGEVIDRVEAGFDSPDDSEAYVDYHKGGLMTLKISTNRGREITLDCPNGDRGCAATYRTLIITPGTTLTGFYWSWDIMAGIISIGAISEKLDGRK